MEYISNYKKIEWSKYKQEYVVDELTDNYIFNEQIKKIKQLITINTSFDKKSCVEDEGKFNRLIGITGERGSGKSSLLKTLKFNLKGEKSYENFYVLPIVDPNKLDHQMGILEIILSTLYLEIEKKREESCSSSNHFNEVSRKIINQLGVVSKLAISKSDFRKHFSNEEILGQYHKQLLFEEDFHDLFSEVWALLKGRSKDYYKRGYLVILIDDIDLVGNDLVYVMLEDIKRVLSNNVTTIVTYRYTQLLNSIYDSKIKENEHLLKHKMIDNEEIRLRTSTYVEKMFLQNHIVKMPVKEEVIYKTLNSLFNNSEKEILRNNGFVLEKSIIQNIYYMLKSKTLIDMYSLDINERALYESGLTLRGIIQIFEFLSEDLKCLKNNFSDIYLIDNLKKVKKYFWVVAEQFLDIEQKHILEKWDLVDSKSKNYIIYKELYYILIKNSSCDEKKEQKFSLRNLLAINKIEAYNVCLGDIVQILNVFKDEAGADLTKYHLIYTIKIFYSIELLESLISEFFESHKFKFDLIEKNSNIYLISKNSNDNNTNSYWETKYYHLTRYKILPDNVSFLSNTNNRLDLLYPADTSILISPNNNEDFKSFKDFNNNEINLENENFDIVHRTKSIESLEKDMMRLLDKILYTSVSSYGDINNISRFKIKHLNSRSRMLQNDPHSLRYRHYFLFRFNNQSKLHESDMFSINEVTSLKKNSAYPFDPYSYLVKEQYVSQAIENYNYLFYSLFDIDLILTKNHDNKKNTPYNDLLNSVNNIFSSILRNKYNLSNFLDSDDIEDRTKQNLYSDDEINYLVQLTSAINRNVITQLGRKLVRLYGDEDGLNGSSKERKEDFIRFVMSTRWVSPKYKDIILGMKDKKSNTPSKIEKETMQKIIEDLKKIMVNDMYSDEDNMDEQ